jgi:hypothetical protein
MLEIIETIYSPDRAVCIQPTIVKEYANGVKIIEYHWRGAEYAYIEDIGKPCTITNFEGKL